MERVFLAFRGDSGADVGVTRHRYAGRRMVFTALGVGAVAELERDLIAERVRAGLRNARAKGKRLGRPRVVADRARIGRLREQGLSWARIAAQLGVGRGDCVPLSPCVRQNPAETTSVSPCVPAAD